MALGMALFSFKARADELIPPALPVFYYGRVIIESAPAPVDTVIIIKKLTDNTEFASTTPAEAGKYYHEMACTGIVGQSLYFTLGGSIAGETVCPDVSAVASVNLDLLIDSANPKANQWSSGFTIPSSLAPEDEARINFTPTLSGTNNQVTVGASGLIITRDSIDPLKRFEIAFSAGTVITGSAIWDGSILAPTLRATSTVDVPDEPGMESNVEEIIELGFSGEVLNFDRPVRIFMPGQSGKRVGYSRSGVDFTEITEACPGNNGSSLTAGINECKFDDGADLFIWTNHFTSFITYIQTALPPPPPRPVMGGGFFGGSSPAKPACREVQYGEWGVCADGFEARTVITIQPANCELTEEQTKALKRDCQIDEEKPDSSSGEKPDEEKKEEGGIVLGEKIYPDGDLIRSIDRRIYYLENQTRRHIINLEALKKFKGMPIRQVSVFTLNAYPEGEKIHEYGEGDLIRESDKKIYLIKSNKKVHIKSINDLKNNYFGKKIIEV